jgi:1-acyl-sn-glycerol-3-phosphate acyltransferase
MFWWLLKFVFLGPVLRLLYRPRVLGVETIPDRGGAILAANHLSALDTLLLPVVVRRRKVVFLGKAELFDRWYAAWFFKGVGVIPIRRGEGSAADEALRGAVDALRRGELVGIFPEGTRSPDGRLYRGKTGVGRMALQARVPVVPVAIVGTAGRQSVEPRKRPRIEIRFGKPLEFARYRGRPEDRFVLRSVTDEVMYEIMSLSGQEYVDEYASGAKARPAERDGAAPGRPSRPSRTASKRSRR